jgi:predicted ester cyclase
MVHARNGETHANGAEGARAAEQERATVRAFFDSLGGQGDPDRLLAADVSFTAMETGEVTHGREAVAHLLAYLHREAFAAAPEVKTLNATPGRVVVVADFAGRHIGEFAGVAPTGREVRVPYVATCEVVGEEIVAIRAYLPLDALLQQLR